MINVGFMFQGETELTIPVEVVPRVGECVYYRNRTYQVKAVNHWIDETSPRIVFRTNVFLKATS